MDPSALYSLAGSCVAGLAVGYLAWVLLSIATSPRVVDPELGRFVEQATRCQPEAPDKAAACLDRCLQAAEQIDRNANQATLIECWLDDLATA